MRSRGCQQACEYYRADLRLRHAIPSMSGKGTVRTTPPWLRSESFWGTLKTEAIPATSPMICDYITTFYYSKGLHSSLGYIFPLDFEASLK